LFIQQLLTQLRLGLEIVPRHIRRQVEHLLQQPPNPDQTALLSFKLWQITRVPQLALGRCLPELIQFNT
jgi:hypothetical protein